MRNSQNSSGSNKVFDSRIGKFKKSVNFANQMESGAVGPHNHPSTDIIDFSESVDDRIAALIVPGNNIDVTYNDGSNTLTIDVETLTSADLSDFNEAVDDRVANLIVAGNNIDVTYNDGANTLTIDVEPFTSVDISDFNEAAQDAVGTIVDSSLTYVDGTPILQRSALTGAIVANAGSNTTTLGSFTTAQLNTAISDGDIATGGGTATGTNTGDQNTFGTVAVSGQSDVIADQSNDTLTLVAGSNITITTNAGSDSITISSSGGGGSASITSVEVDFTVPSRGRFFNIAFVGATVGQQVIASPSIDMPTGLEEDELEMEPITVFGKVLSTDNIRLFVGSLYQGPLHGKRNINIILG